MTLALLVRKVWRCPTCGATYSYQLISQSTPPTCAAGHAKKEMDPA